uniref:EXPERA domain-containing protein n=1 Tax=Attheya septentrionalis TaxID=420275 RepID=A0A7S2UJB6_9STRA|mmetsp:Transcript_24958/g.45173  ORF Transcript_24958/g.45173 Transcript_24958/m.45173 type:complete len:145 (+) Transcript_24958:1-435(+)
MMDSQAIVSREFYPQIILDTLEWYAETFKDPFMVPDSPPWFRSLILCELLLQVPFFFVSVYALWTPGNISGSGWFRSACMIYGAHTSTTLIPILATIASNPEINTAETATLFGFYLPYLILPLLLTIIAASSEDVFGPSKEKKS